MKVVVCTPEELMELIRAVLQESNVQSNLSDPPSTTPKELLSLEECAAYTGFAKSTIYSLVSRRAIPYAKKNGRLFFFRSAIETWIGEGAQNKGALQIAEARVLEHRRKRRG